MAGMRYVGDALGMTHSTRVIATAFLVFGVVVVLAAVGLSNHQLWGDHEPYIAGIVGDMERTGDLVVPTLNGHPFLEKPPLYYWLADAATRVGGDAPWTLRLPSAVLGLFVIGVVAWLAWRISGPRAARWAALLVATTPLFVIVQHEAVVDMALAAGVTLALGAAALAIARPSDGASGVTLAWLGAGVAFLAKGPVGPLLVAVPVAAWAVSGRDVGWVRAWLRPRAGLVVAVAACTAWVGLLWSHGGWPFIADALVRNSIGRFTASDRLAPTTARLGEHVQPFYAYLASAPFHVGPVVLVAAAALFAASRWNGARDWRRFVALALASDLALLSMSAEKRGIYLLPLLPLLQWLAADWLDRTLERPAARRLLLGTAVLVALTAVAASVAAHVSVETSWPLALLGIEAGLGAAIWYVAVQRSSRALAVDGMLAGWALFLVVLLAGIVPAMDRQTEPQLTPYRVAEAVAHAGARIYAADLVEGQLGHLTRALDRDVPELRDVPAVRAALGSKDPVVVVVGRNFYRAHLEGSVATLLPPQDGPGNRAPVLVTNDAVQSTAASVERFQERFEPREQP